VATTIPPDVLRKWQGIVDLCANIMHVPSAVVTTIEPPYSHYRTLVSSNSTGNPFPVEEIFSMEIGTFCETVIKNREPLLVANALEDDRWKLAPEITVGMVSYLGFPVLWPDGRMFGTICVLDDKANRYSDLYQELLVHCRDVLQGDLQTLARLGNELEEQRAHLSELFARVPSATRRTKRSVSGSTTSLLRTNCRRRSKASCIGWSRPATSSRLRPFANTRMARVFPSP
jgi:hypothetical protein